MRSLSEEYPARRGWGHSTVEYAVDVAVAAGVKRLALFHHDPLRDDAALDKLLARGRQRALALDVDLDVVAAAEGSEIEIQEHGTREGALKHRALRHGSCSWAPKIAGVTFERGYRPTRIA